MLDASIFSISRNVLRRHCPQGHEKSGFRVKSEVCMKKAAQADSIKPRNYYFEEENIPLSDNLDLTHSHTMTPFDAPGKQAF